MLDMFSLGDIAGAQDAALEAEVSALRAAISELRTALGLPPVD